MKYAIRSKLTGKMFIRIEKHDFHTSYNWVQFIEEGPDLFYDKDQAAAIMAQLVGDVHPKAKHGIRKDQWEIIPVSEVPNDSPSLQ